MGKVLSRLDILLHANTANYRRDIRQTTSETKAELKSVSDAAVASSKKIDASLNSLLNMKNAIAGVGVAAFASSIISTADKMQNLASKIKISTDSTEEYVAVMHQLREISRENAASYGATVELYADSRRALKELGKSQQETIDFTSNLSKAMMVGGGAAQAQAAALTQLGQALASGVLRGDEFNSVAEQAPVLLDLLAKELGTTRGALRKLASDGALTSDVIYNAISSATDVLDEKISKMPVTFTQAVGVFKDQYAIFVDDIVNQNTTIGQSLGQVVLVAADNFATLAKAGVAVGSVWLANTVASSGLAASIMGLVAAQVASAKAAVTNAISTQGQVAAINNLHIKMMLLRMTKTHYIALTKQAITDTIAYTRSLAGLASGFNASTAAAAMHARAIAAGNVAKKAAIASSMIATSAIKSMGNALKSVGSIITKHPLMIVAATLSAIVVQTHGLQGAMDSLGDALSVVGILFTDMVSGAVNGIGWLWDSTTNFLNSLMGDSQTATETSGGYFATLFAGTEGGFVGMLQVAASVMDGMLSAVVAFARMSWTNLNQLVISVKNAFKSMGNLAISVFEGIVNAGISRINFVISGMNLLIRGANAAKKLFGFDGSYSEVTPLRNANFGRIAYEDTNYVGYTESHTAITATRDWVDGAIDRHKEIKANADAARDSLTQVGNAAEQAGKAGDKAGKKAAKSAKGATKKIKKQKEAVDELAKAFAEAVAQLEKSIAMVGNQTAFGEWLYDLKDANNQLSSLDAAGKNKLLGLAINLDVKELSKQLEESNQEVARQLELLEATSDLQREHLQLEYEATDLLNKYQVLLDSGLKTQYEEIKNYIQGNLQLKAKLKETEAIHAVNKELSDSVEEINKQIYLMGNDSRLDAFVYDLERTEKYALASAEEIERMKDAIVSLRDAEIKLDVRNSAAQLRTELLDYATPGTTYDQNDKLLADSLEKLRQARELEQMQHDEYDRLAEIAKKRHYDKMIELNQMYASDTLTSMVGMTRALFSEQSSAYRFMFAAQQSFVMASAGMNMYEAWGDAMAEGATMSQKLAAGATIVAEFGKIISAASSMKLELPGFKTGGFTSGGENEVVGFVHGEEFVANAGVTRTYRPELEAMHNGTYKRNSGNTNINVSVKVESNGQSTVESNQQLGKQLGAGLVEKIRQVIAQEKKAGGMLYA